MPHQVLRVASDQFKEDIQKQQNNGNVAGVGASSRKVVVVQVPQMIRLPTEPDKTVSTAAPPPPSRPPPSVQLLLQQAPTAPPTTSQPKVSTPSLLLSLRQPLTLEQVSPQPATIPKRPSLQIIPTTQIARRTTAATATTTTSTVTLVTAKKSQPPPPPLPMPSVILARAKPVKVAKAEPVSPAPVTISTDSSKQNELQVHKLLKALLLASCLTITVQ